MNTTVPLYSQQRFGESFDSLDIQVVARFVEDEHVGGSQQQACHAEPRPLAPAEHFDLLVNVLVSEQQSPRHGQQILPRGVLVGDILQMLENRLPLVQAGVNVLGVGADLDAVSPLHGASQRIQGIDE